MLNPLLTMLVLTQVFQMLLRVQVENFPTFYIIGWALWNFFSESTTLSLSSILTAAPLIKKVYVPKYMVSFGKMYFFAYQFPLQFDRGLSGNAPAGRLSYAYHTALPNPRFLLYDIFLRYMPVFKRRYGLFP